MCTVRYVAKGFSLFGVRLMYIAINIQRWVGEWYRIFVVPHPSAVSASSCIQVKILCFTIVFVNKDHGSEWIRAFITLVWHVVLYDAFITQRCQFVFYGTHTHTHTYIYIYIYILLGPLRTWIEPKTLRCSSKKCHPNHNKNHQQQESNHHHQ